ncbi:hypothetical protein KXX11_004043, partial [Aspergillus fumigatus]
REELLKLQQMGENIGPLIDQRLKPEADRYNKSLEQLRSHMEQQLAQGPIVDAELQQVLVGPPRIVERGAELAAGLAEDAAVVGLAELPGVAGAAARQGEGQRPDLALRRLAGKPARVVDGIGHFTLPQLPQRPRALGLRDAEHHPLAAAAREHAEDQARAFGGSAVDAAPHLQGPMPAVDAG